MALARDDRWVCDALGRALAGAQVFWCTQPATVPTAPPPSPLASIFTDLTGVTPITQPVLTDGFGHAFAYMSDTALYTVAVYHPLFGPNPIVLPDQATGGVGSSASIAAFSGVPSGAINGTNTVFTIAVPQNPEQLTVVLNFPLVPGLGYSASWASGTLTITYANAPQPAAGGVPADAIYAYGFYSV